MIGSCNHSYSNTVCKKFNNHFLLLCIHWDSRYEIHIVLYFVLLYLCNNCSHCYYFSPKHKNTIFSCHKMKYSRMFSNKFACSHQYLQKFPLSQENKCQKKVVLPKNYNKAVTWICGRVWTVLNFWRLKKTHDFSSFLVFHLKVGNDASYRKLCF